MRITALKNATHVEVTKFTPEKERTYYIWVTKDQRGKEVLATKQVAIAANPHKVDGLAFKEFNPKGLQSTTIKPTVTKFEKNTNLAYQSFRGCFVPTYGATNLPGQRVNADFKGIVIHHGKKMLKK